MKAETALIFRKYINEQLQSGQSANYTIGKKIIILSLLPVGCACKKFVLYFAYRGKGEKQ